MKKGPARPPYPGGRTGPQGVAPPKLKDLPLHQALRLLGGACVIADQSASSGAFFTPNENLSPEAVTVTVSFGPAAPLRRSPAMPFSMRS